MTLRVGVGGIVHETNTYSETPTTVADFDIFHGGEIIERAAGTRTAGAGVIETLRELGAEPIPTLFATAQPSGVIDHDDYERLRSVLLDEIEARGPFDAFILNLHGAAVTSRLDDVETDLCHVARRALGNVPLAATFDLHANMSGAIARPLDLMFGYRNYPHTDMYETGERAARASMSLIGSEPRPHIYVEPLPMLLPPSATEPGFVGHEMNELAQRVENAEGLFDLSIFHGFPYSDVPEPGVRVVATAADMARASSAAKKVARWIWENKDRFLPEIFDEHEALSLALRSGPGPIVVNDTSDNCGAGAPGDGTHVLRAMIAMGIDNACLSFIVDPEVAKQAHAEGVGATIEVRLGGKTDRLHGEPIHARAEVRALSDGDVRLTAMARGLLVRHGRMARLGIDGIDVLVGSRRAQTFDPEVFLLHGIDVREFRIVVVKSTHHFRAGFKGIASKIITADTPGLSSGRIESFPHDRRATPLWPIDRDASWP